MRSFVNAHQHYHATRIVTVVVVWHTRWYVTIHEQILLFQQPHLLVSVFRSLTKIHNFSIFTDFSCKSFAFNLHSIYTSSQILCTRKLEVKTDIVLYVCNKGLNCSTVFAWSTELEPIRSSGHLKQQLTFIGSGSSRGPPLLVYFGNQFPTCAHLECQIRSVWCLNALVRLMIRSSDVPCDPYTLIFSRTSPLPCTCLAPALTWTFENSWSVQ